MEYESDDQDGLYDSLPEICGLEVLLDEEIDVPQPAPSSLITEIPIQTSTSNQLKKKSTLKQCTCRANVRWAWEVNTGSEFVELANNNMDVKFHKKHSSGTAVVRCTEPMSENQYYWEVKMTYPVYGTDVMVGVGTPEAEVKDVENRYLSLLGMDNKTWGLSYTGLFHHNGNRTDYSRCFGQGDVIGVHLDLWRGTLSFYKDRKNLGIAISGLRGKTLYAMASSTAACSGMRITHSCSFPSSLQFLCCEKLRDIIPDDKNVFDVINIPPGLRNILKNKLSWLLSKRHLDDVDVCTLNHDKIGYEDITDESRLLNIIDDFGFESVQYAMIDDESNIHNVVSGLGSETSQYIMWGSVLFMNRNRFQARQRAERQLEESEDSLENAAKRLRSNVEEPDHDSE